MFQELKADIWDVYREYDAICCTTNQVVKANGELVMGAGIAKAFAAKYPWLPSDWGRRVMKYIAKGCANQIPVFVTLMDDQSYLVYFPTKYHWRDKSDLKLIEVSAWRLRYLADILDWNKVLLPRPGCALGGLDWEQDVRPILADLLDERFTVIHND